MNILITRFPFESALGGEEWHTIELAKELKSRGHKIIFMGSCPVLLDLFKKEGFVTKKTWGGKMAVTPLELIKFIFLSPFIYLSLKKIFDELIEKYKIDRLYCLSLNEKILLTPIAKKRGIKTIWVEHQQIRDWLMISPLRWIYKSNSSNVTIIPISPWNHKKLKKIGVKNIIDIPNGVKKFKIKKEEGKKEIVIGTIARLIRKKGVHFVVQAAEDLLSLENNHKFRFVIIGEGPEKKSLESQTKEKKLENITFAGRLDRKQYEKTFASFDIFILPSIDESETFGLVAAEALLLGIPVVVTKVCGIAKYLEHEKNAFIIPEESSEKITEAIIKLTTKKELANKIASNGKKLAQNLFSFEKMVNQYEKTLK
jgi:glycosyltransferase involved in cell wall biosynthesis